MKKILRYLLVCLIIMNSLVVAVFASSERDFSIAQENAEKLKELTLFQGVSDTDFALDRQPTRTEAIVMLIRLLGKETDALSQSWEHPFTDVETWANNYIGYAYQNGLTNGTSVTTFGTDYATSSTYLTFVLRALGYSDFNNEDFSWSDPYSLAENIGILNGEIDTDNLLRADIAIISYEALETTIKNQETTLATTLVEQGVFTEEYYDEVCGNEENSYTLTEQSFTYLLLREWIRTNQNTEIDGQTAVFELITDDEYENQYKRDVLSFIEDDDCIYLYQTRWIISDEYQDGINISTILNINPYSTTHSTSFFIYELSTSATEPTFKAYGKVDAAYLDTDYGIAYYTTEGTPSDLDYMNYFHKSLLIDSLALVDIILENMGDYSISAFGFDLFD